MRDGYFLKSSCGSPNYAAPELLNGRQYNGALIDIWSCGVILYALLTGKLPFNEKQPNKLYKKIKECDYDIPGTVPENARDLITRMLQKNPLDRISIQEIKQHDWFREKYTLFQIIDNSKYIYGNRNKIDMSIIKQMTSSQDINPEKISEEKMVELVKEGDCKNNDLRVIYDLYQTEQTEKLLKEKQSKLNSNLFLYNFIFL